MGKRANKTCLPIYIVANKFFLFFYGQVFLFFDEYNQIAVYYNVYCFTLFTNKIIIAINWSFFIYQSKHEYHVSHNDINTVKSIS